ncbi:MAG: UDP-N-acetylmuramoyl-L-alanine--D-glutamate ligase [Chitinispirillales bacterium]|nr:UDP-N-acetylmuramoyl-L-alanine--D-glutamate ligase [Chitinispirillales bacterium]
MFGGDIVKEIPKSVAVIGAARSGIAAAKYFLVRGSRVFISDVCDRGWLDSTLNENQLYDGGVLLESEAGGHTDRILDYELIILSPGVRGDLDILKSAAARNIPVWSEMELGFRVSKAPFLAVTGSSGKSTTVSLLASVMSAAGFETALAGNIGTPVIDVTPFLSKDAVVVAEVSSFQLEAVDKFKPRAAAVINLMKNHLDRYACEDDYYNAKKLIAKNLTMGEYLVLNADDSRLSRWAEEFKGRTKIFMFGSRDCGGDCAYLSGKGINYRMNGVSGVIIDDTAAMRLAGRHNFMNACAAAAVALCAGADSKLIGRGLCAFGGLPHRLEFVGETGGVSFYNDSKSTTAESIECAVSAFGSKVLLIAGGKDKGCDFSAIVDSIRKNVKSIVLIGEAKERMAAVWEGVAPVTKAATLEEAVDTAFKNAARGERVVFSPGCSSFDMFRDFEHRGDIFRETVNNIVSRKAC